MTNFRAKDTGVQSSITWFLNFVGALVRVLTTLSETGDLMQMAGYALGASCSGIILSQVCIYGSSGKKKKNDEEAEKGAAAAAAAAVGTGKLAHKPKSD